jgi:hypothetical protein
MSGFMVTFSEILNTVLQKEYPKVFTPRGLEAAAKDARIICAT